jgi:hypothetical protein
MPIQVIDLRSLSFGPTDCIYSFSGQYRFMSNFFPCPVLIRDLDFPDIWYGSTEAAYQAAKTDNVLRRVLISQLRAGDAKKAGRIISLRSDWDSMKCGYMKWYVTQKFDSTELADLLISTWPARLVEGNHWGDTYWGMVMSNGSWVGQNKLGEILMTVREHLLPTIILRRQSGDISKPRVLVVEPVLVGDDLDSSCAGLSVVRGTTEYPYRIVHTRLDAQLDLSISRCASLEDAQLRLILLGQAAVDLGFRWAELKPNDAPTIETMQTILTLVADQLGLV